MSIGRKKGTVSGILTIVPAGATPNDYVAFYNNSGDILCATFLRDAWVADIGSMTPTVSPPATGYTFIASSATAGAKSLAYAASDGTGIGVLDFTNSTQYTYAPTGSRNIASGGVGLVSDKLYWIEGLSVLTSGDITALTFYLMRANCDLTSVTEVGSHAVNLAVGEPIVGDVETEGLAVSSAAIACCFRLTFDEIGQANADVSFTLDGTGTDSFADDVDRSTIRSFSSGPNVGIGIPAGSTAIVCDPSGAVSSRADGPNGSLSALWSFATFSNFGANLPVGGNVCAFDNSAPAVYRAPATGAGSATDTFAPENHPDLGYQSFGFYALA